MKAVVRFRAPSHGQYLSIFIPSSLRLSNFLIVPQQAGGSGWNEGPVQIQENVTEQGVPGKRYLVKVKDGNYGAISLQFQVAFQRDISFYGKRAKIHAGLGYGNVTAGQLTTSQSVELSAGIRTELFRSFSKNPTVISPGIPIEYKFEFTSHFYFPYTSTQPKVPDTESTMFYNFKGVIPIPERVVSVKTKESYVHYNQSSHQIEVDLGDFKGRRKPVTFEVIYPQAVSGTLFQAGEIIFRGKEGKESAPQDQAPLRTFVFSGISETLQAPMVKFQGAAYSPQRKNTLIIDEKDQYLLSFAIKNEGSVPLHNLKIRPMFPSEWRVRGLTLPAPEGYHPEFKLFFESQIHLSGTTNTQRVIHKTFSPQAQIVTPELLGLGEHEYLKEASLTFDHFNPRDWLSETSFIQRTFGFIGDVLKEDKEHQLLTEGQRIHVDTYFSADEFLERRHQASITYTNSSLISWDLVNSAYKEGKRLNKAVGVLQ